MTKLHILLASAAAVALATPAFAADKETYKSETKIEKDAKGNYESKEKVKATDAAGTTTAVEKKVEVDAKSDGSTETEVTTTSSTDPKGLMNKETTKTKDTAEANADGSVKHKHKKTVNGKTVEDTTEAKPAR